MNEEILNMLHEIRPKVNFKDSADFIEDELLDSFDVVSLISKIEEKYGVEISGMEIIPENFCGVQQIVNLVQSHRA